jgi:hypothetical protein
MNMRISEILEASLRRRTEAVERAVEVGVRTIRGMGVGSFTVERTERRESSGARRMER